MKKIVRKLLWTIIYLLFNIAIFFIEINIFFKKSNTNNKSNSGINLLDNFLDLSNSFLNFLGNLAILVYSLISMGLAVTALLLFIPIQIYFIKPKYKNTKKKFLFSLLAAFSVVILLKLIQYFGMYIEINYLD